MSCAQNSIRHLLPPLQSDTIHKLLRLITADLSDFEMCDTIYNPAKSEVQSNYRYPNF